MVERMKMEAVETQWESKKMHHSAGKINQNPSLCVSPLPKQLSSSLHMSPATRRASEHGSVSSNRSNHSNNFRNSIAASRVYRAPQPSIRRYQKVVGTSDFSESSTIQTSASLKTDKAGGTRQRRRRESHSSTASGNRHVRRLSGGTAFSLPRQNSDNSLNVEELADTYDRIIDYSSDIEDLGHDDTSKNACVSPERSKSSKKESRSIHRKRNTPTSKKSTKSQSLYSRFSFPKSRSARTVPSGNSHDSFSGMDYNDDDSHGASHNGYDHSHYQSDILFVESGEYSNSSSKVPLYKSWLKTMRKYKRRTSINPQPATSVFRSIPLRISCYINNLKMKKINWWQVSVIFVLAGFTVHSRRTIHKHRIQIQQYDEERAHILEQMTWIDKAAKRVHQNFNQRNGLGGNNDASALLLGSIGREASEDAVGGNILGNDTTQLSLQSYESLLNARKERDFLREELDAMQIKVQANARDRNHQQFGDNPIQVSLPLYPEENSDETVIKHLVIALSDDTPHAAATLLEQVKKRLWDDIDFQRVESSVDPEPGKDATGHQRLDYIQIAPKANDAVITSPLLEFVEKSRGCGHPGSVSLHQLESDEFHILVLKVHISEESHRIHHDEGDVCIGTVISGLDTLVSRLPQIPVIHEEDEEEDISGEDRKLAHTDDEIAEFTPGEPDPGMESLTY